METLKRKYLRRKILAIKSRYFSVVGHHRSDGKKFHGLYRLVKQPEKRTAKNAVLVQKFYKGLKIGCRLIALEGVKYLTTDGKTYKIAG